MKRTILLLVLLLVGWSAQAQQQFPPLPIDAATRLITYVDVVPTPGIIQANLLARARVWANRVSIADKPPLLVNEMGTDVLVVAGSQAISPTFDVKPQTLYFLARIALREGRYQYRFEEYTLVTASPDAPSQFETAEAAFPPNAPSRVIGGAYATRLRRAFDQAAGQAAINLNLALTTPLAPPTAAGTDW